MKKQNHLFFLLLSLTTVLVGCEKSLPKTFAEQIEDAHHKADFDAEQAVQFNLELIFGGQTRLDGKITLLTNSSKGLVEDKNGSKLYFDHENIYLDTTITPIEGARFNAYTWSYFFLMPYKLSDPGTIWNAYPDSVLNGKTYESQKLTFEQGTGDADQDWYIIYADQETHLLQVAAYIVTAHKSKEEAEKDPHAIVYSEYKSVNAIPIAHKWAFHGWNKDTGLTEELGSANLSEVKFLTVDSTFFQAPVGFVKG